MRNSSHAKMQHAHAFSQFELTKNTLNNLSQFEITPTAKLVLLYLTGCYNPNNADVFPKQSTIAAALGVSERSVVRAVQELCACGLIIIECKNSNRYKFTSTIYENSYAEQRIKKGCKRVAKGLQTDASKPCDNEAKIVDNTDFSSMDKMSDEGGQNVSTTGDKMSGAYIEQKKEKKNNISDDDFKVLVNFAGQQGAKDAERYAMAIVRNGSAEQILAKHRAPQRMIELTNELLEAQRENARNCKKPADFTRDEAIEFIKKTHPKMRKLSLTCKTLAQKWCLESLLAG